MSAVITLTSDLGLTDAYVAAMKGVILGINPDARLVDICHTIRPQNIPQAAFVLSTAYQFFPQKTVHLVVVDPGVGTERRAVILRTPWADFVAPDNGVLSYIIEEFAARTIGSHTGQQQEELAEGLEAIVITSPEFWLSPVSPTFHGRDVFAPVAAHLSLGMAPSEFGEKTTSLTVLPNLHPHRAPDGSLLGHILHIDNFGNLITDFKAEDLPQPHDKITIEVGNRTIHGVSRTYAEGKGLLALIGSSGNLEVSVWEGSARDFLSAGVGDEVKIK